MRNILVAAIASIAATLARPVAAEGQKHRVDMKRVTFEPAEVSVHVGDTLEWSNGDIVAHTATSKQAGFDVNVLPGKVGSTVAKQPGTFDYLCRYHPNMKGKIVVMPSRSAAAD